MNSCIVGGVEHYPDSHTLIPTFVELVLYINKHVGVQSSDAYMQCTADVNTVFPESSRNLECFLLGSSFFMSNIKMKESAREFK